MGMGSNGNRCSLKDFSKNLNQEAGSGSMGGKVRSLPKADVNVFSSFCARVLATF